MVEKAYHHYYAVHICDQDHLGGPGSCSPAKIFQILDSRIALVAIFFAPNPVIISNWPSIMHKLL